MHLVRIVIIALATMLVLAFAVFAFVTQAPPGDDVIIIKGGSLTVQCSNTNNANLDCLSYDATAKVYKHKKAASKVEKIVVKDENGEVLGSFSKVNFPNGKPSVEITYR